MSIGFVHLSDIHFGQEKGGRIWIRSKRRASIGSSPCARDRNASRSALPVHLFRSVNFSSSRTTDACLPEGSPSTRFGAPACAIP